MSDELSKLLQDDVEMLMEYMSKFKNHSFSDDLKLLMKKNKFSSVTLGKRALISHTIVDKWLHGKAKPNGKERMKELGMALGFDGPKLNVFLYKNGYPKLYVKNPLDSAAKYLLLNAAGKSDIVELYRKMIEREGLESFTVSEDNNLCESKIMSNELKDAAAQSRFSVWFREHEGDFTGDERTQFPDMRIIQYIMLYIGDSSINDLVVTGELPVKLKKLLYSLMGRKAVKTRGLRERLIALGLYTNMNEEEIDRLLKYVRLRAISKPTSRLDYAVLFALRMAHDRYPYYEYENYERIVKKFEHSTELYDKLLYPEYSKKLESARQRVDYYDRCDSDSEKKIYEENYTSYSDRGVMDYVRDILSVLVEKKKLSKDEIRPIWKLIQRTEDGASIWN